MDTFIKSIVITGVSSGIGLCTCEKFLKKGYLVFGSVRKKSDALRLKKHFGKNFVPLIFDVTDIKKINVGVTIVKDHIGKNNLTALINNAGIAVLGPLEFIKPLEFQKQMETNLIGVLHCVQAFLPLLGSTNKKSKVKKGRIINISSALGGKIGYPFYGAYCSSKHALEGFSETLRRELTIHKIFVSVIAPGAIQTPIWDKADKESVNEKYEGTVYKNAYKRMLFDMTKLASNGLKPETVATKIIHAVETPNPKFRYTFISEFTLNLLYFAPRILIDKLVTKYLGLVKK